MIKQLSILSCLSLMLFACQQDTERKTDFVVQGIDISHYQARVDWDIIAEQNFDFAFVKASEGAFYVDSLFHNNWDAIQRIGMKRGAYHFFRPSVNPHIQVINFTSQVALEIGDLPPVLDIETIDFPSQGQLVDNLRIWLEGVESFYNIRPILYTNVNFYNRYLAGHFQDYPLWIARYHKKEPTLACGSAWEFWQYGNKGKLEGIDGYVDFNVFHGSLDELNAMTVPASSIMSSNSYSCQTTMDVTQDLLLD